MWRNSSKLNLNEDGERPFQVYYLKGKHGFPMPEYGAEHCLRPENITIVIEQNDIKYFFYMYT